MNGPTGTKSERSRADSIRVKEGEQRRPGPGPVMSPVIALQRFAGNQAVTRSLNSIAGNTSVQAKLWIGNPNDRYEQEADEIAEQLMHTRSVSNESSPGLENPNSLREPDTSLQSSIAPASSIKPQMVQRMPLDGDKLIDHEVESSVEDEEDLERPVETEHTDLEELEEEDETLQLKPLPGAPSGFTPDLVGQLRAIRGKGRPLTSEQRKRYEAHLQHDLSHVRIHTDADATEAARALRARAFAKGNNVVFGAGQYQPNTASGQRLLAHELVHVVQQTGKLPYDHFQSNETPDQSTGPSPPARLGSQAAMAIQRTPNDDESQIAAVEESIKADLESATATYTTATGRLDQLSGTTLDPELLATVREQGEVAKENIDLLHEVIDLLVTLPEGVRWLILRHVQRKVQLFSLNVDHLRAVSAIDEIEIPDFIENGDEVEDALDELSEEHETLIDENIDLAEFAENQITAILGLEEPPVIDQTVSRQYTNFEQRLQSQTTFISESHEFASDLKATIQRKKKWYRVFRVLEILSMLRGRRGGAGARQRGGRSGGRGRRITGRGTRRGAGRTRAAAARRKKRQKRKKRREDPETVRRGIRRLLRSPFFKRGPFARPGGSIRASSPDRVLPAEQQAINRFGGQFGDHHTGAPSPGTSSGNWIGDHMPVTELIRTATRDTELRTMMQAARLPTTLTNQRLYPHSLKSARTQGGLVRAVQLKLMRLRRAKGRR